jgi:hypothetical protein
LTLPLDLAGETKIPTVYMSVSGEPQGVPLARNQTPQQREETITRIKQMLGISWPEGG